MYPSELLFMVLGMLRGSWGIPEIMQSHINQLVANEPKQRPIPYRISGNMFLLFHFGLVAFKVKCGKFENHSFS